MQGLTELRRWSLRRRARDDRGGAATIVAVLLAGGVLLGMTALVVDVGQLNAERERLQSVSDSTAFAIALDCAMDRDGCDPDATQRYLDDAEGRSFGSAFVKACINEPGETPRGECEDPIGNLTDCLNERPDGVGYVEVRSNTGTSEAKTLLPPSFAQTLVSGYEGTTVGSCARVAWGAPSGGLAATWSACEWDVATQGGDDLAPPPPAVPNDSYEQVISFLQPTEETTCDAGPSGFDAPGAFGWLDDDTGFCEASIVDDQYGTDPGNNITHECVDVLSDARANKTVLAVPVYRSTTGPGNNTVYTLEGMAGFVVTGYNFPGPPSGGLGGGGGGPNNVASYLTGHKCDPSNACLIGYYVYGLVNSGEIGEGPIMGAVVVRTVG